MPSSMHKRRIRVVIKSTDKELEVLLNSSLDSARYEIICDRSEFSTVKHVIDSVPDILVLELDPKEKMPELVISVLREVRPNLKIIALTPVSSPNDAKVIEQGIFYYLAKPLGEELVEAVRAAAKAVGG